MICQEKHTKYQPTDAEWRCPWCEADNNAFYIDEPATDPSADCDKLHEQDFLYCFNCKDGLSGKRFAAKIQKEKNLVPCGRCKGTGLVKGKA